MTQFPDKWDLADPCPPSVLPSDLQRMIDEARPWDGKEEGSVTDSALTPLAQFLVSMPDLAQMEIPPREMIVEPFLPTSSLSMTFAMRGVGKTWFVMQLAVAVTNAKPFFEWHVPVARRVLYIDGEMPLSLLQERFSWLYRGRPSPLLDILPSESLWMEGHPLNLNDRVSQGRVQALLDTMEAENRRPALIVLDNWSSLCFGGDSNSNDDLDGILTWLMHLRHQGYAVMVVHHAGKGGDQRGASRREDLLDTSIKLTGTDSVGVDGAVFRIEFSKTRGRKPRPEVLEMSLTRGERGEPVWERVKTVPDFIPTLLTIRDKAPDSYSALGKMLGISRQAATKKVDDLRKRNMIHPVLLSLTDRGRSAAEMFEGVFSAA